MDISYPLIPEQIPEIICTHGIERVDSLAEFKNLQNRQIIQYLKAENHYTHTKSEKWRSLKQQINREIRSRIQEVDQSVPIQIDDWLYYSKYEKKCEYPIYCRKKNSPESSEEVLINLNQLAKRSECCLLIGLSISPNHQYLAYGIDYSGDLNCRIRIKDLSTGKLLPEIFTRTDGEMVWSEDNTTLFYTKRQHKTLRANAVWRHQLKSPVNQDILVYEENDETFECSVSKSKSDRFIFIASENSLTTEYRYVEADFPLRKFKLFAERQQEVEYYPEDHEDHFFILTNADSAKNFKVMQCPLSQTQRNAWTVFLPEQHHVILDDIEVFDSAIVLIERCKAIYQVHVLHFQEPNQNRIIQLTNQLHSLSFDENPESQSTKVRLAFSSFTIPDSIIEIPFIQVNEAPYQLLKQQNINGFCDLVNYDSETIYVQSHDHLSIPLTLVWRKDLLQENGNPTLLYGYGAYGMFEEPSFQISRLSLLDRGFIYAIAHVRGGNELGQEWYDQGRLLNKKNSVIDFLFCARYLLQSKRTKWNQLHLIGDSAGGLLLTAAMNDSPSLFRSAVLEVPFTDVLGAMLDDQLPLTTGEYEEWGNPHQKVFYDYIASYSPYDNIKVQNYPDMLIMTALHDSQVPCWDPVKYALKIRAMATNNPLILLNIDFNHGHAGPSGRFDEIYETATELSFLLQYLD